MPFKLTAPYKPAGDQPKAILELVKNFNQNRTSQVLLGVTGSGKTFTIANAIQALAKPTLVISHNKTLAAQLYNELRTFFPHNIVEYFVSYYDYYQPEGYLPTSNTYIEKALSINDELERLRLSTVSSLLSDRKDLIVIASVSCIYGTGNPETFKRNSHLFKVGCSFARNDLLKLFVEMLYNRNDAALTRSHFRVLGDTIDLFVAYADYAYRFVFWGDELEAIHMINPVSGKSIKSLQEVVVFPANLFVTSKDTIDNVIGQIQKDLYKQLAIFETTGKFEEAKRLKTRTELDIEMLKELGYCSGIENYARYIDGRSSGERPFCLLDYFPKDYLMVIDESHVTIPQFRAMWGGDRSRKNTLVEYGFRLPSAMDNRPLHFSEFEALINQVVFVSATPADYELEKSNNLIVEQIIRPTGLLDPKIEVRPTAHQMHDILEVIHPIILQQERILITTLTKRMAEQLTDYLSSAHIRCRYIHSEIKTLERVAILNALRQGTFDVLVGVNLLREGIDLPQASLMLILDADKEGFLRNARTLIQTIGRVARHAEGRVIMYADRITASMEQAINETQRRRALQMAHNTSHNIKPSSIQSYPLSIDLDLIPITTQAYDTVQSSTPLVTDLALPLQDRTTYLNTLETQMHQAAKALDCVEADRLKTIADGLRRENDVKPIKDKLTLPLRHHD